MSYQLDHTFREITKAMKIALAKNSAFDVVDELPPATKEEFDKHYLYLYNDELYCIIKNNDNYNYKKLLIVEEVHTGGSEF